MTPDEIKTYAQSLGFDDVRISGPTPQTWDRFHDWLDHHYHGEMQYLANRCEERRDLSRLLPSTRSVLVFSMPYRTVEPPSTTSEHPFVPVVSRYAWGQDYHEVVADGLKKVVEYIHIQTQGDHQSRWYVDTAPILEKDFAAQSGIGWVGKHTNLLNRTLGNWFFLGVILTTLELKLDRATSNHCGQCTRCLDVCPTQAFVRPYVLDARRCISYLTIELKGPIPLEFRRATGNRIYGCDDCLQICPWNRFARISNEGVFYPREIISKSNLIDLMKLSDDEFRQEFKGSPIKRIKRRGFLRNVAVALGNTHDQRAVPVLLESLTDREPLIRGHAAWALGEIGGSEARLGLQALLEREDEEWVQRETRMALNGSGLTG